MTRKAFFGPPTPARKTGLVMSCLRGSVGTAYLPVYVSVGKLNGRPQWVNLPSCRAFSWVRQLAQEKRNLTRRVGYSPSLIWPELSWQFPDSDERYRLVLT